MNPIRAGILLAPFFALALPPGASGANGEPAAPAAVAARRYRSIHEIEIVRELAALLTLPNRAADLGDIEKNAQAVAALYRRRGASVRLLRLPDAPPVVYAALDSPAARETVTFYAHYDGQPVDPREWKTAPFVPVLLDRPLEAGGREVPLARATPPLDPEARLYARSASDDKAPIVGFVAALDALKAAGIPLSVNLRFFFEGEEEAGSPHLEALLARYAPDLRTDAWILCDGPVHQSRRPQIFFGARGGRPGSTSRCTGPTAGSTAGTTGTGRRTRSFA
jgi:acetylornithine deacetylase/succinyl-diaminopimelate desuccinylase-like protein